MHMHILYKLAPFVGSCLVYVIIQPIGIQVIAVGSPQQVRPSGTVVIRIIILWHLDGQSLFLVPHILIMQRIPVIFRMPHNKNLPAVSRHGEQDACLFRLRHDHQFFACMDFFRGNRPYGGCGEYKNSRQSLSPAAPCGWIPYVKTRRTASGEAAPCSTRSGQYRPAWAPQQM